MKKRVSAKINGKWRILGNIKVNQYGNLQLSFKNTEEFKNFVTNGGDWLNFSLFDEELDKDTQKKLDDLKQSADESEIPF